MTRYKGSCPTASTSGELFIIVFTLESGKCKSFSAFGVDIAICYCILVVKSDKAAKIIGFFCKHIFDFDNDKFNLTNMFQFMQNFLALTTIVPIFNNNYKVLT